MERKVAPATHLNEEQPCFRERLLNIFGKPWNLSTDLISWSLFDTGTWGYNNLALQTLTPILFDKSVQRHYPSIPSPVLWGYVYTAGVVLNIALAPVLGAWADGTSRKMTILGLVTGLFGASILLIPFLEPVSFWLMVVCAVLAFSTNGGMLTIYGAILKCISDPKDTASALSASTSYASFGSFFVLLVYVVLSSGHDNLSQPVMQIVFALGFIWLFVFTSPLVLFVSQRDLPFNQNATDATASSILRATFRDGVQATRSNPELLTFLVGSFVLQGGTACLNNISLVFGASIRISQKNLATGQLVGQLFGALSCFVWHRLSHWQGSQRTYCSITILYLIAAIFTLFVHSAGQFWLQCALVHSAANGLFVFWRELLTKLTRAEHSGHTFSVMASLTSISGALGPFLYSAAAQTKDSPRAGFVLPVLFIAVGSAIVMRVDFERGQAIAHAEAVPADDASCVNDRKNGDESFRAELGPIC